ncbi:MAG: hypothetical protein HYY51_03320 [Candidatus Magasanikbacteria bacterium]|nr:hypothetical protein [Candidatus Magasanikbacteria bacterium]
MAGRLVDHAVVKRSYRIPEYSPVSSYLLIAQDIFNSSQVDTAAPSQDDKMMIESEDYGKFSGGNKQCIHYGFYALFHGKNPF